MNLSIRLILNSYLNNYPGINSNYYVIALTLSPIVLVACPAAAVLFNTAAEELAGTPGRAGKSSWDIVNSLGSIAGCFTIPTRYKLCRIVTYKRTGF